MEEIPEKSVFSLRRCLLDLSEPIAKRTHAAFFLRTLASEEAMHAILEAIIVREDSSLMRHELGYILGQMGNPGACRTLATILMDESEDVLVRHECAEALGAIGDSDYLELLESFCSHPAKEVSETCQIARDLIIWRKAASQSGEQAECGLYQSVDPAPPFFSGTHCIEELQRLLMDVDSSLFNRYRAMFSLRDLNSDLSALALATGLSDESALFRHEIAYVLGQMQRPCTIPRLEAVLKCTSEHRMVRHEAAESIGSIGGTTAEEVLKQYFSDEEAVVQQSCEVALDTMDYWNNRSIGERDTNRSQPIKYL